MAKLIGAQMLPPQALDVGYRVAGFAWYQSYFSLPSLCYPPVHPLWNGNVNSVPLSVGSM